MTQANIIFKPVDDYSTGEIQKMMQDVTLKTDIIIETGPALVVDHFKGFKPGEIYKMGARLCQKYRNTTLRTNY